MNRIVLFAVALALVFVFGCGRDQSAKKSIAAESPSATVKNEILVTVNGNDFTEAMLKTEISINTKVIRLVNPNVGNKDLAKAEARLRKVAVNRFIDREAVLGEAKRRGLKVSPQELDEIHAQFVKSLDRRGKLKFEDVLANLTAEESASLQEALAGDKLYQKAYQALADETKVALTSNELAKAWEKLQRYQAKANEREGQVFREATNVWKCIAAGSDFNEIGAAVGNEHVKFDGDWGTFELEYFKDDVEFCKCLSNLKAGDVTPPIPADGGLMIAKVLEIVPPSFEAGSVHPQYRLAEIFFELPEKLEVAGREDFQKTYVEEISKKALKAKVEELKKNCTVVRYERKKK